MMRWGFEVRERAADLFELGLGYKAVATKLGMSREAIREWSYAWRAMGREGLLAMGRRRSYAPEVKLAAARARIEGGESVVDTMARFKIANRRQVSSWCRLYERRRALRRSGWRAAPAAKRRAGTGRLPRLLSKIHRLPGRASALPVPFQGPRLLRRARCEELRADGRPPCLGAPGPRFRFAGNRRAGRSLCIGAPL